MFHNNKLGNKMQRLTDLWQNLVRYRDEDVPDPDAGDSQADHEQSQVDPDLGEQYRNLYWTRVVTLQGPIDEPVPRMPMATDMPLIVFVSPRGPAPGGTPERRYGRHSRLDPTKTAPKKLRSGIDRVMRMCRHVGHRRRYASGQGAREARSWSRRIGDEDTRVEVHATPEADRP